MAKLRIGIQILKNVTFFKMQCNEFNRLNLKI